MQTLQMDEFLRSLKQNIGTPHALLLGAGASVESGVPSAADCIWEWKKEIYLSQNPGMIGTYDNAKQDNVRRLIQRWINTQNSYPTENSPEEYSFFVEKAYRIPEDRRRYFQGLVAGKEPSLGYHLIAMLAQRNIIKSVWTTNFDGLMVKCAHLYTPLVPIEITAQTSDRLYRGDVDGELLCVALHGDYKYGDLKNTEQELDTQDDELVKALRHELMNRDLIVFGYSGRDQSLMQALTQVYSERGAGKLFWCGYGSEAPVPVAKLIEHANENGRSAFYIATSGFDSAMYAIARHCMSNDTGFISKVDEIKRKLAIEIEPQSTGFFVPEEPINKVANTNAYPIIFPSQCYQFEIAYIPKEKPWDYCRELYKQDIMAAPYNGMIYAWGAKETIEEVCSARIKGSVELCPLTRGFVARNGAMQELLLKTITRIMAEKYNLGYSKDKIWDTKDIVKYQIGGKTITAFSGVRIAIVFDSKNTYLTFAPSYMYADGEEFSKEEKKQFADKFSATVNNRRPNPNTSAYILKWVRRLLGNDKLTANYPIDSGTPFRFLIGARSALLGINYGSPQSAILKPELSKRIIFRGKEYKDPQLQFYNPVLRKYSENFHPMLGLINNAPVDHPMNNGILRHSIVCGVICPTGYENTFSNFIAGLNQRSDAKHNIDFLVSFPGFYEAFKAGLDLPNSTSSKWQSVRSTNNPNMYAAAVEFGKDITRKIDQLSAQSVDAILIYIPEEYEFLTAYSDGSEKFDLHDYVKAYAAQRQVATQFVRQKTIASELHCQIMWALSLALYVKSGRIPWTITGTQPDTAFAGIGYSVMRGAKKNNVVVGCSHIYSSDGQGMKYRLSKIHDVQFDRKDNPYLSEDEAYRLGLTIKDLFHSSFSEIPKRVVIHKRTPFRKEEIKGLVESLSSAGIKSIDLIEIAYEDDLKCFALNQNHTGIDDYPVRRGMCFPISENTMYLYTHGIAPSVRNPKWRYFQGGKSVPLPLKVVRHYGSSDMAQIATEILGLSKMNWNSFNLYSKLPCTIESSNEIARIGWLLSHCEGSLYDYRYFM